MTNYFNPHSDENPESALAPADRSSSFDLTANIVTVDHYRNPLVQHRMSDRVCYTCGGEEWRIYAMVVYCARCHPPAPPATEAQVKEVLAVAEQAGWPRIEITTRAKITFQGEHWWRYWSSRMHTTGAKWLLKKLRNDQLS